MLSLLHLTLFNVADLREKDSTLDSIIYFINRNFMEKISLADIAVACSCSESTVSHIFKSHTGTSVGAYILNLRIEQSKNCLIPRRFRLPKLRLSAGLTIQTIFQLLSKEYAALHLRNTVGKAELNPRGVFLPADRISAENQGGKFNIILSYIIHKNIKFACKTIDFVYVLILFVQYNYNCN